MGFLSNEEVLEEIKVVRGAIGLTIRRPFELGKSTFCRVL